MGKLYDIIQQHIDAQPHQVHERAVAKTLGVTQTTLSNWRSPKRLIAKEHLVAIARVTRVPYSRVLDALLDDIGYLHEDSLSVAQETLRSANRTRRQRKNPKISQSKVEKSTQIKS